MHASIWSYPWDIIEDGPDRFAATVADAGLNSISTATSYHAGRFLRPHAAMRRIYETQDGTVYFRPDMSKYTGELKPQMADICRDCDPLEETCRAAEKRKLNVVAWNVSLHNSRLGKEHPNLAMVNVFGDYYRHSLCPSRQQNAEYIAQLATDMSERYRLHAVELEAPGFLPYRHGLHHEMYGVDITAGADFLLSLCFCDGCTQAAARQGIDVAAVQSRVVSRLENFFAASTPLLDEDHLQAMLAGDEQLATFCRIRCDFVTNLVVGVRSSLRNGVKLFVIPSVNPPCTQAWKEGANLSSLAKISDAVEVLAYMTDLDAVERDLCDATAMMGDGAKFNVGIRPCWPDSPSQENVVGKVRLAKKLGAAGVSFYNYGHMRLENLGWIRESLK